MLLGEPARTQLDLPFKLFGFPIRITAFFWLAAVLLGYGSTQGDPQLLISWVLAVLLSILIHELGHAFAFRYFGTESRVVLYHFGGLAIPDGYGTGIQDPRRQIAISFAGPVAQISGALIVMALIAGTGHQIRLVGFLGQLLPEVDAPPIENERLFFFTAYFLYVSVYWALLNLLPIYPLDGGQIARELFVIFNRSDGIKNSLILSVCTAGAVGVFALLNGEIYMVMMFGMLGASSYQTLQAYLGRGGGFGGRW